MNADAAQHPAATIALRTSRWHIVSPGGIPVTLETRGSAARCDERAAVCRLG